MKKDGYKPKQRRLKYTYMFTIDNMLYIISIIIYNVFYIISTTVAISYLITYNCYYSIY